MSNSVYRFRPEKRVGRLHRRGDRVRAWRQAAEAWRREAEQWRRQHEREQLLAQFMTEMARGGLKRSAKWFFFGTLAGAAVMAFVK